MQAKFNVKPKLEICSARSHLHGYKGKKESLEGPHRKMKHRINKCLLFFNLPMYGSEMNKNKFLVSLAKYSVVKKLAADCIS